MKAKVRDMPEQNEYFDKYLDARFKHIDESVSRIEQHISEIKTEVKQENRLTRRLVVTTAISLLVGFTAIAVSIFFGFSKLQTSWIQTVISFVGKTVVK